MSQVTLSLGNLSKIQVITKDKTYDITDIVYGIQVKESIFSPFITGSIAVSEVASISIFKGKKIPTDLSSKIDFSFSGLNDDGTSPQQKIQIKGNDYYIYKIEPGVPYGNNQASVFHFAHKSMYKDKAMNMSKCYKKKKISEMVTEIGKKLELSWNKVESTHLKFSFVLPYRTPVSQIMFLAPYARSEENPMDVNYVFYQTLDGKHNFVSVGSLLKQQPSFGSSKKDGFYLGFNRGEDFYTARRSILSHIAKESNQYMNAINGMHSSAVFTLDTISKIWAASTFFLPKIWNKQSHLSNKPIVEEQSDFYNFVNGAFDQRYYAKSRHSHCCKEQKNGNNKIGGEDDWLTRRISSMEQLNQISLYFVVTGNSDINKVSAGKVIFVNRATFDDLQGGDILQSGKFLISTITHTILRTAASNTQYSCEIMCIKDSIGEE